MDTPEIPTLTTARLRLRAFRGSDLDDYAALNADPEVLRYLAAGTEPWDRGRSWRHLAFLIGHWQLGGAGMWVVERRRARAFLGVVGFAEPEGWPGFELAWKLARRFWGHGYATEAARAALDHAFTVWRKQRVISLIHPDNHASIRVAERLGERLQGRSSLFGHEMLCYGIDRKSYPRLRPARPEEALPRSTRERAPRGEEAGAADGSRAASAGPGALAHGPSSSPLR